MLQHDHKHVFAKFHRPHDAVERDLSAILPLMVVPDNDLVACRGEHKHNKVCLIHHFNDLYALVQVLDLLLDLFTRRVVLDYLEAGLCGHREVLLTLIRRNHFDSRGVRWDIRLHNLLHFLFNYQAIFGLDNFSGRRLSILRHLLGLSALRRAYTSHCLLNKGGFMLALFSSG